MTGEQLPINASHPESNTFKGTKSPIQHAFQSPRQTPPMEYSFNVGDLVYLWADREKTHVRDRYIVLGMTDGWCKIRKFTGFELRAKVYDVKVSDCYPVVPSILLGPNPPTAPDMHNPHLSDEDEPQMSQMDPPPNINCSQPSAVLTQPVANEKFPPINSPPPPQVLPQPMEIERSPAPLINPDVSEQPFIIVPGQGRAEPGSAYDLNRPVSQIRAPPGGLSRTSGKL